MGGLNDRHHEMYEYIFGVLNLWELRYIYMDKAYWQKHKHYFPNRNVHMILHLFSYI